MAVHDVHRERLAARLRRVGGTVQGEVRGARADVRRLFENPLVRGMLLSHGERHAREFYGTWAKGLLPAKYLTWFVVIYPAATASSVGVPFCYPWGECPVPLTRAYKLLAQKMLQCAKDCLAGKPFVLMVHGKVNVINGTGHDAEIATCRQRRWHEGRRRRELHFGKRGRIHAVLGAHVTGTPRTQSR